VDEGQAERLRGDRDPGLPSDQPGAVQAAVDVQRAHQPWSARVVQVDLGESADRVEHAGNDHRRFRAHRGRKWPHRGHRKLPLAEDERDVPVDQQLGGPPPAQLERAERRHPAAVDPGHVQAGPRQGQQDIP
jgi:hypothetical protein